MTHEIGPAELRELFLFEALSEDRLRWLADHGEVVHYSAGDTVYREGEAASCFVVLLDGTIAMTRMVRGGEIEITRTDRSGVYGGDLRYLLTGTDGGYANTLRAVTDCKLYELPIAKLGEKLREWSPLHMHILNGLFARMDNSDQRVSERERLVALGQLTAGLTHELNNPAAATARTTETLRERVVSLRARSAELSAAGLTPAQLDVLTAAAAQADGRPDVSPLEISDREDELGDWLAERGVADGYDLAAEFVTVGLDIAWAQRVADAVPEAALPAAMSWLATGMEIDTLLGEVADTTRRITALLDSARQYTQMDRAPGQRVDVHELLDATLAMLAHKFPAGIELVKHYDRDLPPIAVYGAELNQVWTNLIVNALDAMDGTGTLTVTTSRIDDTLVVEIADTGPGIPDDVRPRVFEPFFSTKPVGKGTGLGLDISWRIVVKKHHGDLTVDSHPGDTRFRVRLPLNEAAD